MMNTQQFPRVSLIVPCYNYGRFLKESLDSVLAQTYSNWECVIIDNGSTDSTREVAKGFSEKDARFIYHYTEQKGVSFARNLGVNLTCGQYILPLDADDKIAPSYLEKAVRILENRAAVKVVYCEASLFGAASGPWVLPSYSFKDLLVENSIFCTALYRRSDFESSGGYNEAMREGFEDWDFWIRLLKDGGEVYQIPEILFYYRIRPESRNSSLDVDKQLRLRRQIMEHHREYYERFFSIPDLIFEAHTLAKKLEALESSRDFKLGSFLLAPIRSLLTIFKKKQT